MKGGRRRIIAPTQKLKKNKAAQDKETLVLTKSEQERNSLYVKYKKSKLQYEKALKRGADIAPLKCSMEDNLKLFLDADGALPVGRRLWKDGYTNGTSEAI